MFGFTEESSNENLYVNYLSVEGKPFVDFTVVARPIAVINMKQMYEILTQLSRTGIADAEFKGGTIFIKGDDSKVAEVLDEKSAFVGHERKTMKLNLNEHLNIMRVLFYKALFRYAERRGFRSFWGRRKGGWKKLLPLNMDSENLAKQGLFSKIGNDLAIYRGLYIMLEIFDDGDAALWVDLYSPIVKLSEQRPISPKEAKALGLKDIYTSFIPKPLERFKQVNKLLNILCDGSKLNIVFADGQAISFTCDFQILKAI